MIRRECGNEQSLWLSEPAPGVVFFELPFDLTDLFDPCETLGSSDVLQQSGSLHVAWVDRGEAPESEAGPE